MLLDEDYKPDPGKVLFSRDTGWAKDAPAELKSRLLRDIPDAGPAPRVQWVYARNAAPPRQQAVAKAKYAEAKRAKPKRGRPLGVPAWNRNEAITAERILEARDRGPKTTKEIAAALRCKPQLVTDRMMEYRRDFPADAAARGVGVVCRCSKSKRWDLGCCHKCSRTEAYKSVKARRDAENRRLNQQIAELQAQGLPHSGIAERVRITTGAVTHRLARMRREQRLVRRGIVAKESI